MLQAQVNYDIIFTSHITTTSERMRYMSNANYQSARFSDIDPAKAYAAAKKLTKKIETVIIGKHREVVLLATALFAGTHVLIEDVPGVGKTTLAGALSAAAGLDFRRAQFTPDITASDITGYNIYSRNTEKFEFTNGLVMTNILLADEINRASPKTQSALLEAMEEGSVTVDGKTYDIPKPFMVIATQNPSGFVGTHPLPEAQLDRFGIRLSMGYPSLDEEINIVEHHNTQNTKESVTPVMSANLVGFLRELVTDVKIDREICRYIVTLCRATRTHSAVSLGASPRASIIIKRLAQAYAFMNSRAYVIPEDVFDVFKAATAHRLILNRDAVMRGVTCDSVIDEILSQTEIPYKSKRPS